MSGGGDSSSEYGIAINDINNSGKRLSKTEGYVSQAEWSKEYFNGRILGQLIVLLIFVVLPLYFLIGGIWLVILVVAILLSAYIIFVIVKHRRLKNLREKQLIEFRRNK